VAAGTVAVEVVDIREHGLGRHRTVDDAPYGGGAGMVLRVDVVAAAIEAASAEVAGTTGVAAATG
jgi:tRNA (guanine37-N1)-methyltransferase